MKRFFFIAILLLFPAASASETMAQAGARSPVPSPELVIYDNDWSVTGSGGYVAESSLMLLLTNPRIKLLGLTAASGDAWRDEGVTSLLRFLELVGAARLPVHKGAVFPLVNSAERHAAWEARYGKFYWSGAWNDATRDPNAHPDAPWKIVPPREGMPRLARPARQNAVAFLIEAVHRFPHRITLYAEGPLTNIALAIRQDPDFARLVGRIIIQGGAVANANEDGSKTAEFNFLFDPEAADIVLTAPWGEAIVLGDASNHTLMTPELLARIKAIDTPAGRFAADNAAPDLPLWSELGAAIIADPAIIRRSVRTIVSVSLDHDQSYGRTRSRPAGTMRQSGERAVTLVTEIDGARLADAYVQSLSRPVAAP